MHIRVLRRFVVENGVGILFQAEDITSAVYI